MNKIFLFCLVLIAAGCSRPSPDLIGRIDYEAEGCFGTQSYTVLLYQKEGHSFAAIKRGQTTDTTVPLSQQQIDSFQVFVAKLKLLKPGGVCTLTESYKVTTQEGTFHKKHNSCKWEQFERLNNTLFGALNAQR